jgi:AcrR family transcriptional regulator/predicted transcriptional regulator
VFELDAKRKGAMLQLMPSAHRSSPSRSQLRPRPAGLPRGHVTEVQRNRVLAATVEVVTEIGYARMTVAQIIARARVSRKTFYDVFADREDCFLAVFDQSVERARALAVEAYEREPAWRDAMRAGLASLLTLMDEDRALARLCVVEALGAGDRVLARRREVLEGLAAVVDRGRDSARAGGEPAPLTAEAVVGAVFAVLHTRLLDRREEPLGGLLGSLMSIIVLPYLGTRAAGRERARPQQVGSARPHVAGDARAEDPLRGLNMRLTYRTVRVLSVIDEHPGASNREIAERSGITDQGQISKLLTRLARLALVENRGDGQERGASNAWYLTPRGEQVERAAGPR